MRKFILISLLLLIGCSEKDQQMIWAAIQTLGEDTQKTAQQKTTSPQNLENVVYKVSQAIEPTDPTVRTYAVKLAAQYPGEYNAAQICSIWYDIKNNWRYVSDPHGQEYFAPANETIKLGLAGDCDDFAILMASLIEAIGGASRVILTLGAEQGDHAYCEVFMTNNEEQRDRILNDIASIDFFKNLFLVSKIVPQHFFHWHKNSDGYWLNLDWSADYPGGPFSPAKKLLVIYPDGRSLIGPDLKY